MNVNSFNKMLLNNYLSIPWKKIELGKCNEADTSLIPQMI